jgi:hypothetical protein
MIVEPFQRTLSPLPGFLQGLWEPLFIYELLNPGVLKSLSKGYVSLAYRL